MFEEHASMVRDDEDEFTRAVAAVARCPEVCPADHNWMPKPEHRERYEETMGMIHWGPAMTYEQSACHSHYHKMSESATEA